MKRMISFLTIVLMSLSVVAPHSMATADVQRITKEELKGMLGGVDVIVLDVRTSKDWNGSRFKIKGAIREDPGEVSVWADKYPKGKSVILYCA